MQPCSLRPLTDPNTILELQQRHRLVVVSLALALPLAASGCLLAVKVIFHYRGHLSCQRRWKHFFGASAEIKYYKSRHSLRQTTTDNPFTRVTSESS